MTAMRGCPYCPGWMLWNQYACNNCNGTNARKSYDVRTGHLVTNLTAAAIEEMRMRAVERRLKTGVL